MRFSAETSAAQGLKYCNRCGECCRSMPCLLEPADVPRLQKKLGETELQFAAHLQIERTADGRRLVRMKSPCDFLDGNLCRLGDDKPKGGLDFECWNPLTFVKRYPWSKQQLRDVLGFEG